MARSVGRGVLDKWRTGEECARASWHFASRCLVTRNDRDGCAGAYGAEPCGRRCAGKGAYCRYGKYNCARGAREWDYSGRSARAQTGTDRRAESVATGPASAERHDSLPDRACVEDYQGMYKWY